ncbi:hypothetical protein CDL15_Pgr008751 [Punica granatum]|nr:hypothetical protein CDL15_Pgr008751 [Punica granatum]
MVDGGEIEYILSDVFVGFVPELTGGTLIISGNGSSSHCEEGSEEKEKQKAENRKPLDEEIQEEKQVKILSLTKELKRRKIELECRLFELYGLKEEYSYIAHLRKELTVKTAETDGLNLAIDSIQAENERLKDDIREVFLAEKQLEAAQKRANELEEKLVFNANRLKGQLEKLEGQVSRFQKSSKRCADDPAIEKKLSNFSRLELEVLEMRRKNKELELEKRELMIMLNATHSRTSNLSKTAESEVMSRVAAEASALRNSNKELLKQVERLQKQRFGMVEELVYQRWLNCCLRRQARIILSFRILRGSQSSISERASLAHKAKKWGRSKIDSNKSSRLIRRFSTSKLPSKIITPKKGGDAVNAKKVGSVFTDSPEKPRFPRPRRVSFNAIVRKLEPEFQETVSEEEMEYEEPDLDQTEQASLTYPTEIFSSVLINGKRDVVVHPAIPSYLTESVITEKEAETSSEAEDLDARTSNGFSDQSQRRSEVHIVKLIAAFSALVFVLLLLCLRLVDFRGSRA